MNTQTNRNPGSQIAKSLLTGTLTLALCTAMLSGIATSVAGVRAADDDIKPGQQVCPEGDGWVKYNAPFNPPNGNGTPDVFAIKTIGVIDQLCVKGGSRNSPNGYLQYFKVPGLFNYTVTYQTGDVLRQAVCLEGKSDIQNGVTRLLIAHGDAPENVCADISHVAYHIADPGVTPTPTPSVSPTPSATPEVTPSATPAVEDPGSSKSSKESKLTANIGCNDGEFVAVIELKDNGQPGKYVNVKFRYNGIEKIAKTNDEGRTSVTFTHVKNDSVYAYPEDGYQEQSFHVEKPTNCQVQGNNGQVLGATTYAATGAMEDMVMNMVGYLGVVLTAGGSALYAAKKRA